MGGSGQDGQTVNTSNEKAGNGGIGTSAYSAWGIATGTGQLSGGIRYYAGGGAGQRTTGLNNQNGTGGLGGGGSTGSSGAANTGGGGSGGNGTGGSGIVIVRYAV
jgi:hypothetical protein